MPRTEWEIIRRQVAIAGRIVDKSNTPLVGVPVTIISTSGDFKRRVENATIAFRKGWDNLDERIDRTISRWDGLFYFMDLPDGQYTVSVHPGGQDTVEEKKVPVVRDKENNLAVSQVDFTFTL